MNNLECPYCGEEFFNEEALDTHKKRCLSRPRDDDFGFSHSGICKTCGGD